MIDFITSDTHFGHENVIKFDNRWAMLPEANCPSGIMRPFRDSAEMDEYLIDAWNSTVKQRNRSVWHLGDFAFRYKKPLDQLVPRLYGHIHLVYGNHDDQGKHCAKKWARLFASTQHYAYLKHQGVKINMSHYAMRTWRASSRGSWMLHGHSHGRLPPYGLSLDAYAHPMRGYRPYSFEEVRQYMAGRKVEVADREIYSGLNLDDNEESISELDQRELTQEIAKALTKARQARVPLTTCPWCEGDFALNLDGRLPDHSSAAHVPCEGGGYPAETFDA